MADDSKKQSLPQKETSADDMINEPDTDMAVDEIQHQESDKVLETEDPSPKTVAKSKVAWYKRPFQKKKVWIPAAVIIVLAILAAVPFTRYSLTGIVWKQSFTVKVIDSQTNQPVSEANIVLANKHVVTNNKGLATVKVAVGHKSLVITKQYYTTQTVHVLVPILKQKGQYGVTFQATGRQVPIIILNKVGGSPVGNILLAAAGTQARTASDGKVTMVLPANKSTVSATISGSGFNTITATIHITAAINPSNTFQVTPSGTVYFLSNASGTIDVASANLDGTKLQTVLAGTGDEKTYSTDLVNSSDWAYLALNAKRDTLASSNSLYLIATQSGKLTTIDNGNANFNIDGWIGHDLIYDVTRNDLSDSDNGRYKIKSFNADTGQITVLDQSQGVAGSDPPDGQDFNDISIVDNEVIYIKSYVYGDTFQNPDGSFTVGDIFQVNPDGTGKKTIHEYHIADIDYSSITVVNPDEIYITEQGRDQTVPYYYAYQVGGSLQTISSSTFNQPYYTYYVSPNGHQSAWVEQRNGNSAILVGDSGGAGGKAVTTLDSTFTIYGWFNNNYLLLEKNNNEMYIMPASGLSAGQQPAKITDFYPYNAGGGGY